MQLAYKTDSLQQVIKINELYFSSIKKVLKGDVSSVNFNKDSIIEAAKIDLTGIEINTSKKIRC